MMQGNILIHINPCTLSSCTHKPFPINACILNLKFLKFQEGEAASEWIFASSSFISSKINISEKFFRTMPVFCKFSQVCLCIYLSGFQMVSCKLNLWVMVHITLICSLYCYHLILYKYKHFLKISKENSSKTFKFIFLIEEKIVNFILCYFLQYL